MIIDVKQISDLIENSPEPSAFEVSLILKGVEKARGLTVQDAATLLAIKDQASLESLFQTASKVKEKLFGRRIVLFAPLYLSNYCTNGCLYCGFKSGNTEQPRKALTTDEIVREANTLSKMGFKRVLLVTGEDRRFGLSYIIDAVRAIYEQTDMRIVHVNAPPMDVPELKELKESGVGVFQAFQETYHPETYKKMHPTGAKKDYDYRLSVMDRALEAGFHDVGIGALLGLYDWRFDVLSTIAHSKHLYSKFGTHAHTISVPRLRPAVGSALDKETTERFAVSDLDFKKAVAVYRLSVPTAGIVVTTREPEELRNDLIRTGASQLSAASRTAPGGYDNNNARSRQNGQNDQSKQVEKTLEQFSTHDQRSMVEVMASILKQGGMPSLCTTCYRTGRVGHGFTEITSAGGMEKFCRANALLTLKEYMLDNPVNGLSGLFNEALEKSYHEIKDPELKKKVAAKLTELKNGKRDLYI